MQILCKYYAYKNGVTLITGINVTYSFFLLLTVFHFFHYFFFISLIFFTLDLYMSLAFFLRCISKFINPRKDSIFFYLVNFHWIKFFACTHIQSDTCTKAKQERTESHLEWWMASKWLMHRATFIKRIIYLVFVLFGLSWFRFLGYAEEIIICSLSVLQHIALMKGTACHMLSIRK